MAAANHAVTDDNFQAGVLDSEIPVLVDFWAEWCAPCVALSPTIEQLAGEYGGKAKVVKLNIDEARETWMKFGIRSIPTLLVFKGGELKDQVVGFRPKSELAKHLDAALA